VVEEKLMEEKSNKTIKIAIDAMGGDFAPNNEILGALMALDDNNSKALDKQKLHIVLVGDKQKIEAILAENNAQNRSDISIVDAKEVITMDDDPVTALKIKRNSSMIKGMELHKENAVDGFISTGNTGAMLTTATMILGRIDGVSRPTIGAFFPTVKNVPTLLIDVGATIECRARFLYEYAVMGSILAKAMYNIENPSIGLLNIGKEKSKGTNEHIEAHKNLSNTNLNFVGNLEGNDFLMGKANVLVTDGFTGNVLLKATEGFLKFLRLSMKEYKYEDSEYKNLDKNSTISFIENILGGFNYEDYGGVPLLGVKGTVIIGHGDSTPKAIMNMIFSAISAIKKNVCAEIEIALKK
jgi:glycerol-3-phosphate acyltransferase PlsX